MEQQRPYKLDLLISRRRKNTLTTSRNHYPTPRDDHTSKRSKNKQMISLTMGHNYAYHPLKPAHNPQHTHHKDQPIAISEFRLEENIVVHPVQSQTSKPETMVTSVLQNENCQDSRGWWQYLRKSREDESRQELVNSLQEAEKKINFFMGLIEQKEIKYQQQKLDKIKAKENYFSNLQKLYSESLEETKFLKQRLEHLEQSRKSSEDKYKKLREMINKDGKYGLNYSPKQVSVFSGASDTILLSKDSECEPLMNRGQNFSFGSLKKPENKSKSACKYAENYFLNPGRACMTKRRLDYNQL